MKQIIIILAFLLTACGADTKPRRDHPQPKPEPVHQGPRFQAVTVDTTRDNQTGREWSSYATEQLSKTEARQHCSQFGPGWGFPTAEEIIELAYDSELQEWNKDWPDAIWYGLFDFDTQYRQGTTYLWTRSGDGSANPLGVVYYSWSETLSAAYFGGASELSAVCVSPEEGL